MSDNIDNRQLLVIKASAGSGKTYNLALQYITHLLFTTSEGSGRLLPRRAPGDTRPINAHRLLLAITFTNKATNEMKERIVNELYLLAQPGAKSDYLQQFIDGSGLPESRIRELARLALNELLFDYSNFNVSTIDSFFQSILRNFARELDRDFNYDIQLEEDYAVRVAVHNFLLSLGHEGQPTQVDQWVKEYQRHMIRDDAKTKDWKFFNDGGDLFGFAKQIKSELFRSRMDEIRAYLSKVDDDGALRSDFTRINAFKKYLHDVAESLETPVKDILETLTRELDTVRDGLSGSKSFKKWLIKGDMSPLSSTLAKADDVVIKGQFLKDFQPDDALTARLLELVTRYFRLWPWVPFLKSIEDDLGSLGLLAMIDRYLEEYRHESNSILIGDTNELIGAVLESGSDFVFERVGSTILHFMIDEFQDTSAKQYENFSHLLHESLSSGHFNMLIGDAKQSIYRFRNADLTVFRERVGEDFSRYIYEPQVEEGAPRSVNYRSSRNIIEFNNSLFEFVRHHYGDNPVVTTTYGDVRQGLSPGIDVKKVPGYVRVITGNYGQLLTDPVIGGAAALLPVAEDDNPDVVKVETLIPGYLLRLHERYEWGQIGILVNTHAQGNKLVECILEYNKHTTGENISIISGESLLLNNSPIIRRIIAMLRFIDVSQFSRSDDDDDTEAMTDDTIGRRILKKRMSDQRLYVALNDFIQQISAKPEATDEETGLMLADCLSRSAVVALPENDDNPQPVASLLDELLPSDSELTTLVNIVETIIAHFKKDPKGTNDVDRETAFLLAFQDCVMQFTTQRNGGSVREFLKYWDEKKSKFSVGMPDSQNAVNIMTIHAAKGLEFDCVLIPYADWELTDNSKEHSYWMPKEVFADALTALPTDAAPCDSAIVPPLLHVSKKFCRELMNGELVAGEMKKFYDKQQTDLLVENLNKTYVAFTRPCSEMHIFSSPDGKSKEEKADDKPKKAKKAPVDEAAACKDVSELMKLYSKEQMAPIADAEGWFEYGVESSREEIQAHLSKNGDSLVKQEPIDQYTIRPIPLKINVKVEEAASVHIKAGLRLHSLLSRVHDRNDLERVIDQGVKHGVITDAPEDPCNLENVKAHVCRPILDLSSPVAAWFDPDNKVYSERTITTASTSLWDEDGIENLRPDRIIRRPDGTLLVIDYKSGQRDDKRYIRQVNRYIDKLRLVFPDTPIAGRIWYILDDTILDHRGNLVK